MKVFVLFLRSTICSFYALPCRCIYINFNSIINILLLFNDYRTLVLAPNRLQGERWAFFMNETNSAETPYGEIIGQ
jgi:hypothetical protein